MGAQPAVRMADFTAMRGASVSPSLEYAARHNEGMLQVMDDLLGGLTGGEDEKEVAHAPGAYWSSWVDALAMIHQRLPRVADNITNRLEGAVAVEGCLGELHEVGDLLDRQGFVGRFWLG